MYRLSYACAVAAVPLFWMTANGCSKKQETPSQPPAVISPRQVDEPVILAGGSIMLIGPPRSGYGQPNAGGIVTYTHTPTSELAGVVIFPGDGSRVPLAFTSANPRGEVVLVSYMRNDNQAEDNSHKGISVYSTDPGVLSFRPLQSRKLKKLSRPNLYRIHGSRPATVFVRGVTPPGAGECTRFGTGNVVRCKLKPEDDYETAIEFCFSQTCLAP